MISLEKRQSGVLSAQHLTFSNTVCFVVSNAACNQIPVIQIAGGKQNFAEQQIEGRIVSRSRRSSLMFAIGDKMTGQWR